MNKRLLAILLVLIMSITLLSGCKSAEQEDAAISGVIDGGENTEEKDEGSTE